MIAIALFPQITKSAIAPFHPAIPKTIAVIVPKCDRHFPSLSISHSNISSYNTQLIRHFTIICSIIFRQLLT
ncbi:hypothetical protein, partial [Microcoleus anatoxicus]